MNKSLTHPLNLLGVRSLLTTRRSVISLHSHKTSQYRQSILFEADVEEGFGALSN